MATDDGGFPSRTGSPFKQFPAFTQLFSNVASTSINARGSRKGQGMGHAQCSVDQPPCGARAERCPSCATGQPFRVGGRVSAICSTEFALRLVSVLCCVLYWWVRSAVSSVAMRVAGLWCASAGCATEPSHHSQACGDRTGTLRCAVAGAVVAVRCGSRSVHYAVCSYALRGVWPDSDMRRDCFVLTAMWVPDLGLALRVRPGI
eukprot:1368707-Prymnesium_polylepis.1